MESVFYVSDRTKLEQLKYKKKPIIALFATDWCPPCKQANAILEKELNNGANFLLACVNCDDAEELNIEYQIEGVPTIIYIAADSMKPIEKVVGLDQKKIQELIIKVVQNRF